MVTLLEQSAQADVEVVCFGLLNLDREQAKQNSLSGGLYEVVLAGSLVSLQTQFFLISKFRFAESLNFAWGP